MTELQAMFPAQRNSPITTLTGALTASQTNISVADASILPPAPNLLVIGGDTVYAETVLMTSRNTSTNQITVTRAVEGQSSSWPQGTIIGRFFTAGDLNTIQENITKLNEEKIDRQANAMMGDFPIFDESGGIADSGVSASDFASSGHKHDTLYEPKNTVSTHNSSTTAHSTQFAGKAAKSTKTTATLSAANWVTAGTYPVYELSISGMTATQMVELIPNTTITAAALDAYQQANIVCTAQIAGKMTLTAFGDKPTVNIPLIVILRGDL